ncbi:MAG: choice-of-anchor A domain-containing protein [Phenylobacterium sp.]|jgi:choice-of-anchor A domain-containing protein
MKLLTRCFLSIFMLLALTISGGAMAAETAPLGVAADFSTFIFGDYKAKSGNNNGAIAVGGNLDIQGYSVATDNAIAIGDYGLLVEGDAKFKSGRLYRGKFRVQGDIKKVDSSVLAGLPNGVSLENLPLDFSIKALQQQYVDLSAELTQLDANGVIDYQSKVLTFQGDTESSIQVFNVVADNLKKAHTIKVQGIPEDASIIVNVIDNNAKKLQVVNKDFSAFIPHRAKTLFNFYQAQTIMLNGVSFEASILAPTATLEAKNGNLMGSAIANHWDGQMHVEGIRFAGNWVEDDLPPVPPSVTINTPLTLTTVGYSPISVAGIVTGEVGDLTLNGVPVSLDGESFSANVALTEGFNTIVARVTSVAGEQITDSIVISLDLTPPYLTIDSHSENQTVYSDKITVTGLVNDIVRGTVEDAQATVAVNGIAAEVANRSYAAKDVPLTEGENLLTISTVDQAGNSATLTRTVIYKVASARKILLVDGQDQTAIISEKTANPLKVQVVDANSAPVAGERVVFRVVQGAGVVGADSVDYGRAVVVDTDAEGYAQTAYQLGYRTGVANHKVRAQVVGYENEVIFYASAESLIGNKISVNSGNNQRGTVNQVLPAPFIVAVTDSGANVVKGSRVRFDVIRGGGVFLNDLPSVESITDSDGRATAQYKLGDMTGLDVQRVQATLIDAPEGQVLTAGFMASAFVAADPGQTAVVGTVLDNQDKPIPGVTIRIEGTDRLAKSDLQGRFKIEQVPVGPVHVIADGSTAQAAGEYPSLSYHMVTVAGVDNPLSAPIYMVKLDTENAVYAGLEDVVLTLDAFPGFKLEIAKDSITFPDGSRDGLVSVTSVNAAKVPMAPPNGMQPQFIVTIQPVGAVFSPAAKLTLPNIDGHAPGAQVEMYSFDHDLEEFVSIGLGTVSEDGSVVTSNPGVGVIKAGWHCGSQPGGSGTAHNCPICQKCEGDACVRDPGQDNTPLPLDKQAKGDCKTRLCVGSTTNSGDIPTTNTVNDCKKPGCEGDSPTELPDDTDISADDQKCSACKDGDKVKDPAKEGLECSDGSTEKLCYTCKDGKCGNNCSASDATSKKATSSLPGFDQLLDGLFTWLNAIPNVVAGNGGISISGYVVEGEHCCTDCTKGAGPKTYSQVGGEVGGGMSVTVAFAGIADSFGPKWFGPFKAAGKFVLAPLAGEATLALSAKGESEKMSTCQEAKCTEMSVKTGANLALGSIGDISGSVEYCPSGNPKECEYQLLAARGRAEATANMAIVAEGKSYLGESCPAPTVSGKVAKVSLLLRGLLSGTVGIYTFEEEIKKELVIFDGF